MSTATKTTNAHALSIARQNRIIGIILLAFALVIALLFGLRLSGQEITTFIFNPVGKTNAIPISNAAFPSQLAIYILAGIAAFLGGWQIAKGFRHPKMVLGITAGVFIIAFLIWASRDNQLNITVLLSSTLLRAAPIALAGLSGLVCERSAVINIAIEGMMLTGAFLSAIIGSLARNVWMWSDGASLLIALIAGIIGGALLGLLLAVLAIRFKVDQIVAGTAINIFATGVTSFLGARILQEFEHLNNMVTFKAFSIPALSAIPIIGPVLFEQNLLIYLLFALVIIIHFVLFYTRWGLRTRAVGEHPKAADTLGIDVHRNRYINTTIGGMIAGLAGCFLVLGSVGRFDELMTAGKGFIGLAAMIFGNWMPGGVFSAALIFGFADSLQARLAILSVPIPSQFLLMTPYLVTMIVLASAVGASKAPAADGQPYEKE